MMKTVAVITALTAPTLCLGSELLIPMTGITSYARDEVMKLMDMPEYFHQFSLSSSEQEKGRPPFKKIASFKTQMETAPDLSTILPLNQKQRIEWRMDTFFPED